MSAGVLLVEGWCVYVWHDQLRTGVADRVPGCLGFVGSNDEAERR